MLQVDESQWWKQTTPLQRFEKNASVPSCSLQVIISLRSLGCLTLCQHFQNFKSKCRKLAIRHEFFRNYNVLRLINHELPMTDISLWKKDRTKAQMRSESVIPMGKSLWGLTHSSAALVTVPNPPKKNKVRINRLQHQPNEQRRRWGFPASSSLSDCQTLEGKKICPACPNKRLTTSALSYEGKWTSGRP